MIQSLGPLDGILGMLPGMKNLKKQIPTGALDDKKFKHMEAIILSMTPKERRNPQLIKGSRRRRIANGSGRKILEVNQLLKQFSQMKKMMGSKSKMQKMMSQMGGMGGPGGMGGLGDMGDLSKMLGGKGKLPF